MVPSESARPAHGCWHHAQEVDSPYERRAPLVSKWREKREITIMNK